MNTNPFLGGRFLLRPRPLTATKQPLAEAMAFSIVGCFDHRIHRPHCEDAANSAGKGNGSSQSLQ